MTAKGDTVAVTLHLDEKLHRRLLALAALNRRGLMHEMLFRLERSLTTMTGADEMQAIIGALAPPLEGSPTGHWRDTPLSDDWVAMHVVERLNEHYPDRFKTMGDLADATYLDFIRVPKVGRRKIAAIQASVLSCQHWYGRLE